MVPTPAAPRRRSGVLALSLLMALAAVALLAGPARAATSQQSLVEDELQMLQSGPTARGAALDDAVALGADGIRALVLWRDIAPDPAALKRPKGFHAADPKSYPAANWDALDNLVRLAAARGLAVLLSPSTPIPAWASRCKGTATARATCKPDPTLYRQFLQALGKRYSGSYADEDGGGVLPRVTRWSFSNEPNQPGWLRPQYARVGGRTVPVAADWYRKMALGGIKGLRASGHARDQILLGETAPIGRVSGSLANRPIPPATFIRALLCMDGRGRAITSAARSCAGLGRFRITGFAHHPYTRGGSQPPTAKGGANEITIASISRLERILDQAARIGRVAKKLPIHYTEYGFQTNPPDRLFGVTPEQQAAYVNQSDYMAYRNPRVRTVSNYKLIDEKDDASFQSGLQYLDGSVKPAWAAWRLPLWVAPRGTSRLWVYGQLRPAAPGLQTAVELQNAPLGAGDFQTVQTIPVKSRTNAFLVSVPRREGRWRLHWLVPGGGEIFSREAVAGA
jgi:hypothetical protein